MKAVTHLAFAGLVGVTAAGFGASPGTAGGAALALGALLPDLDTTGSSIGRFCRPLAALLERKLGHRTLTHSLLGLLVLAVVAAPLLLLPVPTWPWLLLGALTHILLDTGNVVGVPLFWPARLELVALRNRALRVPYGSPREVSLLAAFSLAALGLAPLSQDGFSPWFHRLLGAPYGAVIDYLNWRHTHEVWLAVSGHNLVTGEEVTGRLRVIDALNTEQLLVEDAAGRAYRVGSGANSDIVSQRLTAWRGQRITVRTDQLQVAGRTVAELLAGLPRDAARVHVTGHLLLEGAPPELPAMSGHMRRVELAQQEAVLRAASPADVAWLADLVIERASLTVRAEYAPGTEVAPLALSSSPGRSYTMRLPGLPSLAGLLVAAGDRVHEGQPVARYLDDLALAAADARLADAGRALAFAEEALVLAEQRAAATAARWEAELRLAAEAADRTKVLVEIGSRPRRELITAELELAVAQGRQLEGLTAWTSERLRLTQAVAAAKAQVADAARGREQLLAAQWVRASVGGVVVSVAARGGVRGGTDVVLVIWGGER